MEKKNTAEQETKKEMTREEKERMKHSAPPPLSEVDPVMVQRIQENQTFLCLRNLMATLRIKPDKALNLLNISGKARFRYRSMLLNERNKEGYLKFCQKPNFSEVHPGVLTQVRMNQTVVLLENLMDSLEIGPDEALELFWIPPRERKSYMAILTNQLRHHHPQKKKKAQPQPQKKKKKSNPQTKTPPKAQSKAQPKAQQKNTNNNRGTNQGASGTWVVAWKKPGTK